MNNTTKLLLLLVVLAMTIFACQGERNPIIQDDHSDLVLSRFEIPEGAVFESAIFFVYVGQPNDQEVFVHNITSPWAEMEVTWNNFGGSYAPGIIGSFMADGIGWRSVEVSGLVDGWLTGSIDNYGFLLDQDVQNYPWAKYYSKEFTNYPYQPYLAITYVTDGGPVTENVLPLGDSFIREIIPDQNEGSSLLLYTGWASETSLEKQSMFQFDIEPVEEEDCEECRGGVVELTLRYLGSATAHIEVYEGKNPDPAKQLFEGDIDPDEPFTFVGIKDDQKMGKEISVYVDDNQNTKIHTSCSKPIGPGLVSGDFEVVDGYSKDGGRLCPEEEGDCDECRGGVVELTIGYHGTVDSYVEVYEGPEPRPDKLLYEGNVSPEDSFTFIGKQRDNKMGREISLYLDGGLNVKIHTSCSKPIGPGLIAGDFEVLGGVSKDGGPLCPVEDGGNGDCDECRGGVVELTIGYFGTVASFIEVYEGNHTNPDKLLYEGNVSPEDSFTFVGKQHHNKMGREISLYIDGGLNVKIHTSCSKPIGPGLIAGDFVVLGGVSKDGGPLCPVENGGGDEGWCELGKPMVLTVRYTGQECAFSNHSQNPDKVECDGDPAFESPVRILVIDKANPDDNRAKVWFDGQVELDALFDIDARNGGDSKLKAETHVFIYDLNDNLLQYLEFHTSCSQILEEGDQFGSLVLVDFTPEVRR